jgi:hypothetical protein
MLSRIAPYGVIIHKSLKAGIPRIRVFIIPLYRIRVYHP